MAPYSFDEIHNDMKDGMGNAPIDQTCKIENTFLIQLSLHCFLSQLTDSQIFCYAFLYHFLQDSIETNCSRKYIPEKPIGGKEINQKDYVSRQAKALCATMYKVSRGSLMRYAFFTFILRLLLRSYMDYQVLEVGSALGGMPTLGPIAAQYIQTASVFRSLAKKLGLYIFLLELTPAFRQSQLFAKKQSKAGLQPKMRALDTPWLAQWCINAYLKRVSSSDTIQADKSPREKRIFEVQEIPKRRSQQTSNWKKPNPVRRILISCALKEKAKNVSVTSISNEVEEAVSNDSLLVISSSYSSLNSNFLTHEETQQTIDQIKNQLANTGDGINMLRTAQDSGLMNQTEDLFTKPYQNLNSDRNFPESFPHREDLGLKLQAPRTDGPVQIPPQTQFTIAVEKNELTETEWYFTRFRERGDSPRSEPRTQGQNPAPPLTPDRLRASMVNRVWRIASMVHLTSFPVASVVMADAGWYYDEDTDEMCCYCCCLRIRRSQWDRDDNPAHIHAMESPNCPHINPNITRVPLETVAEIQSENETAEISDSGAEETIASDTDTEPSQRNLNLNVLVAAPETAEQPVFEDNLGIAETNHHHESLAGASSIPPDSGFESCSRQSRNPDVLWTPVCCAANSKDERGRRPSVEPANDLQEDGENVDVERSRDDTDSGAESEDC